MRRPLAWESEPAKVGCQVVGRWWRTGAGIGNVWWERRWGCLRYLAVMSGLWAGRGAVEREREPSCLMLGQEEPIFLLAHIWIHCRCTLCVSKKGCLFWAYWGSICWRKCWISSLRWRSLDGWYYSKKESKDSVKVKMMYLKIDNSWQISWNSRC